MTLNVSAAPFIQAGDGDSGESVSFETSAGGPSPSSQIVGVYAALASSGSVKFQAAVRTDSGGNWLSVTPSTLQTPGGLTVEANSTGLVVGTYTGRILIQGPANTVIVPATLIIDPLPPPAQPVSPASISFAGEAGAASAKTASLTVEKGSTYTVSVQTQSGGMWLSASGSGTNIAVTASTSGLAAGSYQGTVIFTSLSSPAIQVPVTLTLLAPPAGLSVSPASLSFTALPNQAVVQSLMVTSPGGSGTFSCSVVPALLFQSEGFSMTMAAELISGCPYGDNAVTPATVQVKVSAPWPGTYSGNVILNWTGGSVTVPITLGVTGSSLLAPVLASIVNSASETPGPISPGEMITLLGTGIGPAPTGFGFDASGRVPVDLASTEVVIDGRQAPVLYASATQVNAIVPYDVGTTGTATVQVVSNGFRSETWGVPLAPAAPGVFAVGSAGVGQAAALNQDNSPNSAANPAARGSTVQFFGTGEGLTSPQNISGGVTPTTGNTTMLPVKATIGGIGAAVSYHGSAPGEAAGILQVDAVVPAGVTPGAAVPVIITVGGQPSQSGITIAVR